MLRFLSDQFGIDNKYYLRAQFQKLPDEREKSFFRYKINSKYGNMTWYPLKDKFGAIDMWLHKNISNAFVSESIYLAIVS